MSNAAEPIRLERTYDTSAATIWELWTQRLVAGRANELDNLAKVVAERNTG